MKSIILKTFTATSLCIAALVTGSNRAIAQSNEGHWPAVSNQKVVKTPSGLQYYDIKAGTGSQPVAGSKVLVHYTGWLLNKQKFDSSVDRGEPFTFVLGAGQVIRGWDEGVATMRTGGTRRLVVPGNLAYGDRGFPPVIPPNATLVFDVQLLKFQ